MLTATGSVWQVFEELVFLKARGAYFWGCNVFAGCAKRWSPCACRIQHLQKAYFLAESTILLLHCWRRCWVMEMFELIKHAYTLHSSSPPAILFKDQIFLPMTQRSIYAGQEWTRHMIHILYYLHIHNMHNIYNTYHIYIHTHIIHTHSPVFRGVPPHILHPTEIFSSTVAANDSEAPKPNAGPHKLRECLPLIVPGTKWSAEKKCSTSHRLTL